MDKYRLGKKQKRAILEVATGREYLVFPQGKTEHVAEFLDFLNAREQSRQAAVSGSVPHRCPICNGSGIVPAGFYNQTSGHWSSTSVHEQCKQCTGTGLVWGGTDR